MRRVIAVLNQKGGVGKTTSVINLAAYMAMQEKKILIVDADPQGNATSGVGIDKHACEKTLYDVLIDNNNDPEAVVEKTNIKNVWAIPSNEQLAAAEVDLAQIPQREKQLHRVLDGHEFDIVFIDCPPSLGLLTINALTAADSVLIPVQTEYYALEGLGQLLDIIQRVRSGLNTDLEILGVLMTMYDKRTSLAEQVKKELSQHFGEKLFRTEIPRNVRLAEAPSYGMSVFQHDKWSKGARAYRQAGKELMERIT